MRKHLWIAVVLAACATSTTQDADMTFFLTSAGSGNGAALGGLAGADAHCAALAASAGVVGGT